MAEIRVTGAARGAAPGGMPGAAGAPYGGAAREAAPWIVRLARLGYAAKGVVYVVIGALAARLAAGAGGTTTDSHGALRAIGESALGKVSLVVIGVGLLGYAVWRLIGAATDAEGKGRDAKGIAIRLAHVGNGIAYGALGVAALRLLAAASRASGDRAEHWTARLMAMPFGRWLVIAVGAGIVGYALYQLYYAASDKVRKHLDLSTASPATATWVVRFGRFGVAARAVVFALIGWFLVRAGLRYDPRQAGGVEQSLATLWNEPSGSILLGAVAVGLIAFGLFQLANARYRRMRVA